VVGDFEKVYLADGTALDVMGQGDVRIRVHSDLVWKLQKVKHCNTLIKTNLFIKQNPFHKERLTMAFYKVA
jgi:hypothetical protein